MIKWYFQKKLRRVALLYIFQISLMSFNRRRLDFHICLYVQSGVVFGKIPTLIYGSFLRVELQCGLNLKSYQLTLCILLY